MNGGGGGGNEKSAMAGENNSAAAAPPPAPHNDIKLAGEESKERMYESKHHKKVVRVLTVLAYVLSVSLAAIMLSLYYVFLWDPRSTRNVTRFTAAQIPSSNSRPSPTRCPPDLGALPPGIVDGQARYPATTPSVDAQGRGKLDELMSEDEDDGDVEPPRALPRSPPKVTHKEAQPSPPDASPPVAA